MGAWEPREECLGLPKDNPGDIPCASQNTSIIKLPLPTTATMITHRHIGFFSFLPLSSTPTLTLLGFISQKHYLYLRYSLRPVLGGHQSKIAYDSPMYYSGTLSSHTKFQWSYTLLALNEVHQGIHSRRSYCHCRTVETQTWDSSPVLPLTRLCTARSAFPPRFTEKRPVYLGRLILLTSLYRRLGIILYSITDSSSPSYVFVSNPHRSWSTIGRFSSPK